MTKVVGAVNFEKTMSQLLREYGVEVRTVANDYVEEAAEIALKMIKHNSKKRTGVYARDWAKKQQYYRGVGSAWVVYNRKHYRLTHLLENDHPFRDRNGKLIDTSWTGDEVIKDARDYTEAWLADNIIKELTK